MNLSPELNAKSNLKIENQIYLVIKVRLKRIYKVHAINFVHANMPVKIQFDQLAPKLTSNFA